MPGVIGQATRGAGQLLHRIFQLGLLLVLVAVLGLAGLAWRLDQGKLELPWLAQWLEERSGNEQAGMRVTIGAASLVWEGFSRGMDRPLDLELIDVAVHDAAGRRHAVVPKIEVSLSLRGLLIGRVVPRAVAVQGARLLVVRSPDGSLAIDLGATAPVADQAPIEGALGADVVLPGQPPPPILGWLFTELARPPDSDLVPSGTPLSQLRRLWIRDTVVTVIDRAVGVVWRVPQAELDLHRGAEGGLEGSAAVRLMVRGQSLAVTAQLRLPPGGDALVVEALMPTIVPADFAEIAPAFAPLTAVRAPVALSLTAQIGADLLPRQGRLQARMAAGRLHVARGSVPVEGGMAEIEGTMDAVRITLHRLALTPGPGRPTTLLNGTATLRRAGAMLEGALDLHLDEVAFADLAALWPDGVAGPGAKPWVTQNITAGTAHAVRLKLAFTAPPDLSDGTVTSMTGAVDGRDLTVHWLRPVPPVQGVNAKLHFRSADLIEIDVLSGSQAGMRVSGGRVTLSGLAARNQFATIVVQLGGPVADLLAVLNHKRVNLLSRRPLPMRNPAGRVEGTLTVTELPLENDLDMDEVRLSAEGRLSALQLGGIVAGRDLADGALAFTAGNDGLKLGGTATLAGIPAQLQVEMDFRDGPPSQVIQKVAVNGTAEIAQLAKLGLEVPELVLSGSTALRIDLVGRRNGRSELALRADLGRTGMRAEKLNWDKQVGGALSADLRVLLDGDRLAGVDRLRLVGDGVNIQAELDLAAGAPVRLRLARASLGASNELQGEVAWPRRPGDPWVVQLGGATLDATGAFAARGATEPKPTVAKRGPAWRADVRVARLILGPGRIVTGLSLQADNDGLITRAAKIVGRTAGGAFDFAISAAPGTPAGRRRVVVGTAENAGQLLAAFDVYDDLRGGKLLVRAEYDDTQADHPLAGTLEIAEFGLHNPPALGKLLQAVSVYGVFEALGGPDLRFTRLVAPFRYTNDIVDLADAHAFSTSLGITVKGRVDLGRRQLDVQGTVVPSYFLNSLLGRIPLIGRMLSPEAGGGLFAVSYGLRGPLGDPTVRVNPLSAVTPGFLRGLFDIFDSTRGGGAEGTAAPPAGPPLPNDAAPSGGQN